MQLIVSFDALRTKYGQDSATVRTAIEAIGAVMDVSGLSAEQIREKVASLPAHQAICVIGGYDLVPTFSRKNPTSHLSGDDDGPIPTDAPYGAAPGVIEDEYAPPRPVSRIPDGAKKDVTNFLRVLDFQKSAPTAKTPRRVYEEAANEFKGAAGYVHKKLTSRKTQPSLSPPSVIDAPDPVALLSGSGRVHILLHGADYPPDWASLYGRAESAPRNDYPPALSAEVIRRCDLKASVVTFSSCYAAMLDGPGGRSAADQVALACLSSGAKIVLCSTRSNWIETRAPYSGLGPGLVAAFWRALAPGVTAGVALQKAKARFLRAELAGDAQDHPYILKTVLQAQLYGNPDSKLH